MSAGSSAAPPQRPALTLQIKLPCATLEAVRARYGSGLALGTFFVRTPKPRPVGTLVRLTCSLSDGSPCFRAAATVGTIVESPAPEPGMELRLLAIDDAGRYLLAHLGGLKLRPLKLDAFESSPSRAPSPAPPEEKLRRKGPIIGIDLGTANVCVAVVRDGKARIIASREGHNTVPAVVALGEGGKLLVGHPARGQMLLRPQSTVRGSKRLLGLPFDSPAVRLVAARVQYLLVAGPQGETQVQLGEKRLALEEISALVLREAKELAERDCDAEVTRAVITVPACYSDRQRQAVRAAASLAGLRVERILSEPTAAALAFAHGKALHKKVLVYDLGGGTFDASLLELRGNVYEVLATGGDTFLGGIDFDRALVEHLLKAFREQHGVDFPGDRAAHQRLLDAAERAKIALSEQLEARVREPFIATIAGKPVELDTTVSRTELVLLTGHLVDKTLEVCGEVMSARGVAARDLGELLLVGGQSRMPWVRERIRNLFGLEPSKAVHPDEAVALGAALFAHEIETGAIEGTVLVDVLPGALGVGVAGGGYEKLVPRNTPMPHKLLHAPRIASDGQTSLALPIFQGDGEKLEEAEYLGTLALTELPAMARGSAPIEVELSLDAECLLTVSARERSTGRALPASLVRSELPLALRQRLEAERPFEVAAKVLKPSSSPGEIAKALDEIGGDATIAMPTIPAEAMAASVGERTASSEEAATERKGWLRGIFKKKK